MNVVNSDGKFEVINQSTEEVVYTCLLGSYAIEYAKKLYYDTYVQLRTDTGTTVIWKTTIYRA